MMRQSLVAAVQEYAKSSTSTAQSTSLPADVMIAEGCTTPECRVEQNLKEIQKLGLPLGWREEDIQNRSIYGWLAKILGLAITVFAVSLGAPFWFDMLNKIMVVRSTVKPHEKSPDEPAVDREKENRLVLSLDQGKNHLPEKKETVTSDRLFLFNP